MIELIAGGGRSAAAALAGLVIYPLIARALPADLVGGWALLSTAGFLLVLSDLGLTTAVHRAAVTVDFDRARRAVAFASFMVLLVAPALAVASYFFLIDVPALASAIGPSARGAAILVLFGGALAALAAPFRGFVLARGGISAIATARAVSAVTQLTLTFACLWIERSLWAPAAGYFAGAMVELALTRRAAGAIDPGVLGAPRMPADPAERRSALRDGGAALVINIAVTVAFRVDVFVLSRVAPLAAVASYGVASRAIDVSYMLAKQSIAALMPRFGDPARRGAAVRVGLGLFSGVVMAGMTALAFAGQPLLIAWVGPIGEGAMTARVLALLAAGAALQSVVDVPASMLTLGGRTAWASAIPIAVGGAVNIAICVFGGPRYGVLAIAGSTAVGNAISAVLIWASARRMLSWRFGDVARAFAPPLSAGVIAGAVAWPLAWWAARGPLQSAVVCGAALTAAAAVALIVLITMKLDSNSLVSSAERVYARLRARGGGPRGISHV